MKNLTTKRGLRCAIYTRVSTDATVLNDPHDDESRFKVARCVSVIDEARFFFPVETGEWLEDVKAECKACLDADDAPEQPRLRADLESKLVARFRSMPEQFRDDMSFRQLTRKGT